MRFFLGFLILPLFSIAQSFEYNFALVDDDLKKGADAIVLEDFVHITISDYDKMEVSSKRVVMVLNEEGEKYIHAYAPYDNETKITKLKAAVFDANGLEVEKFKERDFLDVSASGSGTLYSDSRVKYLRFTPSSYPYTVLIEDTYQTSDTAFIPNWFFLDGYNVSTKYSSYSLDVLHDGHLRFKEMNLDDFGVTNSNTKKQLRYQVSNLKAIKKEPLSPDFREIAPNIKVALTGFNLKGVKGNAETWEEYGRWIYQELLTDQNNLNESTKAKARQLVSGITDTKEKVRKIYEYLQDNTRYISVQLGIGGWKPIAAAEVNNVKYGDCKGLTNYTMAMLKEVGVESYYTVLYAGSSQRSLDPDFPALSGNHAFLNVPLQNGELWLECTSQESPVDFLGTFSDDRYVLKVTPEGGVLEKSKKYNPEQSKQLTKAQINIDSNGDLIGQIEIKSSGIQYDSKYRLSSMKDNEIEEHYKEYWDYLGGLHISQSQIVNDKINIELTEKVDISVPKYLSRVGENWLFSFNMLNRNMNVPKRMRSRKTDFVLKRGYVDEDDFLIDLPKDFRPEGTLPKIEIKTDFGEYYHELTMNSNQQLRYKRRVKILSGTYPKERYQDYRAFRKKIAQLDNSKIVLTKNKS